MKYIFTLFVVFALSSSLYAQSVNDYKYVIVPAKYEFLKINDQYQVNSLTKFLFNKYGFESYIEGELMPFSLNEVACNALYADVIGDSGFIRTTMQVVLKDCNKQEIFRTSEGSSKDKDYRRAYHEALREAFFDLEELKYKYLRRLHSEESDGSSENKEITPDINRIDDVETEITQKVTISESIRVEKKIFVSEDGSYTAVKDDSVITFKESGKEIGVTVIQSKEPFNVVTSEFVGDGFFLEGRLIVQRKIKGVVGVVEMIFTEQ